MTAAMGRFSLASEFIVVFSFLSLGSASGLGFVFSVPVEG